MHLDLYVENLTRQVAVAAEAGGEEARALAERLVAPLEAAIRLTLQDALAAAADEITTELAPGSVELRLRQLFQILDAVGVEPEEFFRMAYPRRRPATGEGPRRLLDDLEDADAAS